MLIYSIISFVSGFFFSLDVLATRPISVFSLCSFRFDVFLCKRLCFDLVGCRAHDHNLAGVVLTCTEEQKRNSKLQEIASNRPLLLHVGFLV